MTELFNQGYALLVGVGDCAYQPLSLPVTVKDTKAIYAALIDPELCAYPNDRDHIRVLNNEEATRSRILDGLKWLKEKAEVEPKATIFVYYSGHGWFNKDDNSFYLIQHDVKPGKLAGTALSGKDFTEALREIQAERLLVVIDSCHAAGMATSKYPEKADAELLDEFDNFQRVAPSKGLIDLKQGKGRVVFTSSEGEQKSWIKKDNSMSIYTFHFLEALKGAANKPGDRVVTVSNLMNHLGKTVPKTAQNLYSAEQTPHFDFDTVDFAIAKLRGGKGLPERGWDEVKSEAQEKIGKIAEVDMENVQGGNVVGSIGDNNNISFRNQVGHRFYQVFDAKATAERSPAENDLRERVDKEIKQRLKNVKLINLDKEWLPSEVQPPKYVDPSSRNQGTIGENKSILEIFQEDAHKQLLILGEPGAGKTTTMLELAKALLKLAEENNKDRIPVLLELSSWKKDRRTMFAWLADQLNAKYGCEISKEENKKLFKYNLLLMLDGLDELEESSRKNCVKAINNFLKPDEVLQEYKYPWVPSCIVICSRLQEYKTLDFDFKLKLNSAICLKDLSKAQIEQYLADRDSELRKELSDKNSEKLRDGQEQPLFLEFLNNLQSQDRDKLLNVLQRPLFVKKVYDAMKPIIDKLNNFNSLEYRQPYLSIFYYMQSCLPQEKKDLGQKTQTIRLLIWLAKQLQIHSKNEFSIEKMQPSWLPPGTRNWYVLLVAISIFLILLIPRIGFIYYTQRNLDISDRVLDIIVSGFIAVVASSPKKIKVFEKNIVNTTLCNCLNLSWFWRRQENISNQGIRNAAINTVCIVGISIIFPAVLSIHLIQTRDLFFSQFLYYLLKYSLFIGLIVALSVGCLTTCIQHFILRLILRCKGHPRNYAKFLNNAVQLKLLRQVDGHYEFIYTPLKECFAILHDIKIAPNTENTDCGS